MDCLNTIIWSFPQMRLLHVVYGIEHSDLCMHIYNIYEYVVVLCFVIYVHRFRFTGSYGSV